MANTRGTDLVALRTIIRDKGADLENTLLGNLDQDLAQIYTTAMHATWTPVEKQMSIYLEAAQLLFPEADQPIIQLAKMLAEKSFSGVYKIFLRIPTIQFVIKQAAQVWRKYYDKGECSIENIEHKSLDFVLRDFPDLPQPMRDMLDGHLTVIMTIIGCKHLQISHLNSDPHAWRWKISWE